MNTPARHEPRRTERSGDTVGSGVRLVLCLVALAVALLAAPSGCGPPPPDIAPRVITWTLGGMRRDPAPATGDALLLLVPTGKPPATGQLVARACAGASSFLPAPDGSGGFFLACDGRLFVQRTQPPRRVAGQDEDLYIWNLLAFRAAQSPLEMLVSATPSGTAQTQIWLLQIENDTLARASRVQQVPEVATAEAFFHAFNVPRCLSGARQCLRLNRAAEGEQSFLDVWDGGLAAATPLQDLSGSNVADVVWATQDGRWLYMLVGQR
jgi:hypothetical protein